jgi:alpha-tubulin suppressor-like RCC1 family protein/serine/threonine protein phosphatase PrpC
MQRFTLQFFQFRNSRHSSMLIGGAAPATLAVLTLLIALSHCSNSNTPDDAKSTLSSALSDAAAAALRGTRPEQRELSGAFAQLATGGYGTIALERDSHRAVVWGLFDDAAHGELHALKFGGARGDVRVQAVAAGGYHALALLDDGSLWVHGRGVAGVAAPHTAVRVGGALLDQRVTHMAAGNAHSVAVGASGRVFAWGANERGQLGTGDVTTHAAPFHVTSLDDAVRTHGGVATVCAGSHHSAILFNDGALFTWGGAAYGATALGHTRDTLVPTRVPLPDGGAARFVAVSCGGDHTLAQTESGQLFGAGWNEHGQLGTGTTVDSAVFVPVLNTGRGVVSFAAGQYATSAVVHDDGRLYTCGLGEHGALGHSFESTSVLVEVALNKKRARSVSVGFKHAAVLTDDGVVVTFGDNHYSQLGDVPAVAASPKASDARYGTAVDSSDAANDAWIGVSANANAKHRKDMLDRAVLRTNVTALNNGHFSAAYIGVYDGHGGETAVDVLESMLHTAVIREMARETQAESVLLHGDQAEQAFARSFRAVNRAIRAKPSSRTEGAVGLAAVLQPYEDVCDLAFFRLHVGFVGDCGILVSERAGSHELLTVNHRADNADEVKRVTDNGGTIRNNRVGGVLAVTRAFGDSMFPDNVVSAEPETRMLDITTAHDVLVFGTDGFFDYVKPADALAVAREPKLTAKEAAATLAQMTAIENGSKDNILVVVFRPDEFQKYLCRDRGEAGDHMMTKELTAAAAASTSSPSHDEL